MNFGDVVTLETMCYHFYEIEIAVQTLVSLSVCHGTEKRKEKTCPYKLIQTFKNTFVSVTKI